jgi:putative ubiquitin-RnfH superfamily antitoxin RatB of RatAB toxin-antitoxin module
MRVEVVFATGTQADVVELILPAGTTVEQAISASGIAQRHPVDLNAVGVFGRRVPPTTRLAEGDRVEIYRPLVLDPKEQRRRRARKAV